MHLPGQVSDGAREQFYDAVMAASTRPDAVFPALLRYWRHQRGMSQLDLGLAAEVSARHVSFLERGRSQPSVEMVALLAETLDVPLRDRNDLLRGAGFNPQFPEPDIDELISGPLGLALDTMLRHHEPYPMMVFDRLYNVVRVNSGGELFFAMAGVDDPIGANLMQLLFDETPRALIANWDQAAAELVRRLQREVLHRPNDEELAGLLAEILGQAGVPADWRQPDLLGPDDPMLTLNVRIDAGIELYLLATITAFNAPGNVTLDELRIESYLPLDEATRLFFESPS